MVASKEASLAPQISLLYLHNPIDLTTVAIAPSDLAQLKTQQELASAWRSLLPSLGEDKVHVLPSIEHAVRKIRTSAEDGAETDVLVTGSLHLIGGVIEVAGLSQVAL